MSISPISVQIFNRDGSHVGVVSVSAQEPLAPLPVIARAAYEAANVKADEHFAIFPHGERLIRIDGVSPRPTRNHQARSEP